MGMTIKDDSNLIPEVVAKHRLNQQRIVLITFGHPLKYLTSSQGSAIPQVQRTTTGN